MRDKITSDWNYCVDCLANQRPSSFKTPEVVPQETVARQLYLVTLKTGKASWQFDSYGQMYRLTTNRSILLRTGPLKYRTGRYHSEIPA